MSEIEVNERPLITFALFAYNQERFIGEAVEGAFSQTYRPLEIILSDDSSSDRTFQIIQELATAYKGPHTIVLNRNETNLGIGAHINKIMKITRGELIIMAGGDDISLPERVEKTYKVYEESGGRAMSIYSTVRIIDEHGRPCGFFKRPLEAGINDFQIRLENPGVRVTGCSHAWHRKVFDVFGNMLDETIAEDRVLPFRASLLGTVHYLDEPLVLYRQHGANISNLKRHLKSHRDYCRKAAIKEARTLTTLRNYLRDLNVEHSDIRVDAGLRDRVKKHIRHQSTIHELNIAFLMGNVIDRARVICQGFREGLPSQRICRWLFGLVFPYLYGPVLVRRELENGSLS